MTRHRLGREQRIHDRFFRRLDRGIEERVQPLVRNDGDSAAAGLGITVADGEGQQEVAARILACAARPCDPQRSPLRHTRALVRQQRRVGRDEHDDRTCARLGRR